MRYLIIILSLLFVSPVYAEQSRTYLKAHNASQLMQELHTVIPALRPVDTNFGLVASMSLSHRNSDGFIQIIFPDEIEPSRIDQVVRDHVAQPVPDPAIAIRKERKIREEIRRRAIAQLTTDGDPDFP